MTRSKVIFDTDPGIDDAMALLFLAGAPGVDLIGVTTVLGNGTIATTTRNALYLKQRFALRAPVFQGAGAPLNGEVRAPPTWVHGENGLGDVDLGGPLAVTAESAPAHRFIIDAARRHPGEVSIIAVGRMTNLALALRADPGIARLIKQVVVMGGAFGLNGHTGNVTPVAEANIHGDPLAADEVFGASWPLVVVGLDVTQQTQMSDTYLRGLAETGGDRGRFIWDITRFYVDFHRRSGHAAMWVHDSSAVAYWLDPSLFTTRTGAIRVLTEGIAVGQTIQKPDGKPFPPGPWDGRPSHAVCVAVESGRFLARYRETILGR